MTSSSSKASREFADIQTGTLPPISWFNPPVVASDHPQLTTSFGPITSPFSQMR